jgi:uncharacterized membrane protein YdbT with pleckstrin-like domain
VVTDKNIKNYSKYLASGEEIVAIFKIGDKYFWTQALSNAILIFIIIGIPRLFSLIHLRHAKTYILTNRRVLVKDGVFSTNLTSAPYDKITHITVKEDFLPKIAYGIGDITIHTAGPTPVEIDLIKVFQPMKVKNLIEELMVKERSIFPHANDNVSIVKKFI